MNIFLTCGWLRMCFCPSESPFSLCSWGPRSGFHTDKDRTVEYKGLATEERHSLESTDRDLMNRASKEAPPPPCGRGSRWLCFIALLALSARARAISRAGFFGGGGGGTWEGSGAAAIKKPGRKKIKQAIK